MYLRKSCCHNVVASHSCPCQAVCIPPSATGSGCTVQAVRVEDGAGLCFSILFPVSPQGRLRCLGSPSRLKARYGGTLALEVQAGAGAAAQAALAAWAAAELGAELQARMLCTLEDALKHCVCPAVFVP